MKNTKKIYEKPSYEKEEIFSKASMSCHHARPLCNDNNPSKIQGNVKKNPNNPYCEDVNPNGKHIF
jgi:hypothetical protein